jgi:hypothetical protein
MPYELIGNELMGYWDIGQDTGTDQHIAAIPGYPGGATLRTRAPTKAREQVLGFDSVTAVAAAATANITSRPQLTFRPDRLVVAGSIAASFLINDLRIGKNSQFLAGVAVPAEAFGQQAFGVRLKLDTAQVSQDIVLNVTNTSGAGLRFNAVMIGPAVE